MKAIEQYFPVVLFIMSHKMFGTVNAILTFHQSDKDFKAASLWCCLFVNKKNIFSKLSLIKYLSNILYFRTYGR